MVSRLQRRSRSAPAARPSRWPTNRCPTQRTHRSTRRRPAPSRRPRCRRRPRRAPSSSCCRDAAWSSTARRLRTTVEVRCGYATTGRCDATGQLFVTVGGKRTQIGSWQGRIPGQQVFAPTFHLTKAVRSCAPATRCAARCASPTASRARRGRRPVGPADHDDHQRAGHDRAAAARAAAAAGRHHRVRPAASRCRCSHGGGGPPTATVAGLVNPRGEHTTFHFEYGPANGAYTSLAPTSTRS